MKTYTRFGTPRMWTRVIVLLLIVGGAIGLGFLIVPPPERTGPTPPSNDTSIPGVMIVPTAPPEVAALELVLSGTDTYPRLSRRRVRLMGLVNGARTTRGRTRLKVSRELSECAHVYARKMRRSGVLAHSADGCGASHENVGMGPNLYSIHRALWESRGHRRNLLCDCRRIGVGAVQDSDGTWWVVQVMQ